LADLDSEFRFLTAALARSVALLRTHPHRSTIDDAERGSALSNHIDGALDAISAKLGEAERDFAEASNADKREYIKRTRLLNSYARFMHKAVPWISAAAHPPLTLGALYFIDELGERICGARPDAVANPVNEFSTEWWPFRRLCSRLGVPPQQGAIPIVLNFPELEAASHLLLPLYGHELGHTAVETRGLAKKVLDIHNRDADFAASFNEARDKVAAGANQPRREAGVSLGWRLLWWTTELLCDQLAVQALGPSFLYAFCCFLLGDAWDEPGERHPPTCVRVAHLLAALQYAGWDDEVRVRTPRIFAWIKDEVATTPARTTDPASQFLVDAIEQIRGTVRTEVETYLGETAYALSEFKADIDQIADLAACQTLPAQRPGGGPIDRRAIMLAAWLSALTDTDDPANLATAPADTTSQAFFAKAIEMSAVLQAWRETA
jgi:hypothetical protein